MPKVDRLEGETLEFKRQWTDRALEDLAAFANTRGGTLLVGIREDGEIVGTKVDDQEIQRITNLIAAHLGITPSIRAVEIEGLPVLEIQVAPATGLVPYGGRYLRRVGTTNRDFAPPELARHLLERSGRTWDGL
ncbi:MAG: helix-turn-helix domain-containing protein, partial [Candidatus Saccharicenans sp.]